MVTAPGPRPAPGTARAGARPRGAVVPRIADGAITSAKIADTIQNDHFGMGKPGLADSARGSAGHRVVIPRRPRIDSDTLELAVLAVRCTAQMEITVAGVANAAIHANTGDPPDILFDVQAQQF